MYYKLCRLSACTISSLKKVLFAVKLGLQERHYFDLAKTLGISETYVTYNTKTCLWDAYYTSKQKIIEFFFKVINTETNVSIGVSTRGHCWTECCDTTTLCVLLGLCVTVHIL